MIWLAFALVTLAALAMLLYPLLRTPDATASRADYDLAIYRAQLAEVDSDMERGVLAEDQANAVRMEIQRRMLDAASFSSAPASDHPAARRTAAIVLALILPLGAGLFYASYGNPQLSDRPYAWRLEHDPSVILAHAAEDMERDLAAKPSARGYERLAGLYLQQQDFQRAAAALKRAIRHGANDASDWAALGETLVLESSGAVGPEALAAFAKALALDAREPRARFYAGLAEAQAGHLQSAVAIWRDLEKDSKANAPWLTALHRMIEGTAKIGKFDPATVTPNLPSAAAVDAMKKAMATRR